MDKDAPMPTAAGPIAPLTRAEHWRKTRRLSSVLLLLWLLTGFCAAYFARELAGLSVFGWPLSFYLAAQGASLVYLGILGFYAWRMRRLDLAAARPATSATPATPPHPEHRA
jgi:putative solute:sodium symporter small subunit